MMQCDPISIHISFCTDASMLERVHCGRNAKLYPMPICFTLYTFLCPVLFENVLIYCCSFTLYIKASLMNSLAQIAN